MQIGIPTSEFETLSIKKNNLGHYILYGLIWWNLKVDGVETKTLCSIKSGNLKWKYDCRMEENHDWVNVHDGRGGILNSFLSSVTRNILYNFTFENVFNTEEVLFELTILNGKKDEFMNYNIYEGLESYVVKINVAGVKKEDVKIVLEDGIIRVKTNPKTIELDDMDIMVENFKPVKSECEIYLPNVESVEAKIEEGILVLTVPKVTKGIKIDIQ